MKFPSGRGKPANHRTLLAVSLHHQITKSPNRTILHVITRLIFGGAQQNTVMSRAAQVADKPWREHVILTGLVPHERVGHLLTAVDVKVLPSYQEWQRRTRIEALLCGSGIVAYNVGGMPSICIDGDTGRLVEPGDRAGLAEAIAWMFEHPEARRMVQMIEQVYENVLIQGTGFGDQASGGDRSPA